MSNWVNYHSHCNFCDGTEAPEAYILHAIKEGFLTYGFSSHSPVPFKSAWNMKNEDAIPYILEIGRLKKKYSLALEIVCGMEVDYIPGEMGPKHPLISTLNLEFTIGSVHYLGKFEDGKAWEIDGEHLHFLKGVHELFNNNVEAAVKAYFARTREMIHLSPPDILGHLDKIKIQNENGTLFSENSNWYKEEMEETLKVIKTSGVVVEVNTRGIYKKNFRTLPFTLGPQKNE